MYTDSYMRVTVVVVLVLVVMKLSQDGRRACGCGDPFPRPSLPHGLELLHRLRRRHVVEHVRLLALDSWFTLSSSSAVSGYAYDLRLLLQHDRIP